MFDKNAKAKAGRKIIINLLCFKIKNKRKKKKYCCSEIQKGRHYFIMKQLQRIVRIVVLFACSDLSTTGFGDHPQH